MWCTWCFRQRTCGLVNWRDRDGCCPLSAVGYRLSAIGCPLSDVRCPMVAGTVFPKVDAAYGQALTGLRVDGPLGRRFLRGLSLTRLWREGCGRAPLNYRRRPLMKKTLQPPCGRRKTGQPPWWAKEIPPLVANATTFPPLRGDTITRAYCRAIYEESVSRCFILPLCTSCIGCASRSK